MVESTVDQAQSEEQKTAAENALLDSIQKKGQNSVSTQQDKQHNQSAKLWGVDQCLREWGEKDFDFASWESMIDMRCCVKSQLVFLEFSDPCVPPL